MLDNVNTFFALDRTEKNSIIFGCIMYVLLTGTVNNTCVLFQTETKSSISFLLFS